MSADWPFLWAFVALVGLLLAPVRYVTGQVAPEPAVWAVGGIVFVACFIVADWLDRTGFRRLGADPEGAGTFVALQFLVVPSIALAAVPAPGTAPWLAVVPTYDPSATRSLWFALFTVSIPIAAWLSLYGGLARLGVDVGATATFVLAWLSLALVTLFVAVLIGDLPRATLTRTLVLLEGVAAVVAYGPTQGTLARNV